MPHILLYGAGRTGRRIAEHLVPAGVTVTVAGRHPSTFVHLAEELGASVVGADTTHLVDAMPADVDLVLNAAGPFGLTAVPVAQAALAHDAHYVDLSNELGPIEALLGLDELFRARGRLLVPAAGFGSVATDLAAHAAAAAAPGADELRAGMLADGDGRSAGAAKSTAMVLAAGGARLVDGQLRHLRVGSHAFRLPGADGYSFPPLGLAGLVTMPLTTGISTVSIGPALRMGPRTAAAVLPLVARLSRLSGQTAPKGGGEHHCHAWAEARGGDRRAWAVLRTGEGYDFSARAAAAVVDEALRSEGLGGLTGAVAAFGPALAQRIGDVEIAVHQGGGHDASAE